MKILELTAFSSGICGVWVRTLQEAKLLTKKGHEVHVFSSSITRGTGEIELAEDTGYLVISEDEDTEEVWS